tara:strand:- start:2141 stop:2353 length:213 start_codon:yes stop_codon:yes gene_type:complete
LIQEIQKSVLFKSFNRKPKFQFDSTRKSKITSGINIEIETMGDNVPKYDLSTLETNLVEGILIKYWCLNL